ncbi:MAG: MBL fold metallo-hydrolase [Candidatus Thorarchaeota archaeon]|jgi:glyoxylase-like metal-dependent hydrolase (beta-lactamase superfamily II)
MAATEIVPGIYAVRGKFADEFGFITSYLVVDNDTALVIDPGTAGDPGDRTLEVIRTLGLDPSKDVTGILCTHGHPDHVGGAFSLKKATNAPVIIHANDEGILRDPQLFIQDRFALELAERLSMKLDRGPLRVNYKGVKADRLLSDGEKVVVGDVSLDVIHTGGHCTGHCVFHEPERRVIFAGDEASNFPNDPRKFYLDLTGSITSKSAALNTMQSFGADYLLPSHDVPHLFGDVNLLLEEVIDGVVHFQDSVLHHLSSRGEADVEQVVFDVKQARSIPVPTTYEYLLSTTIQVILQCLEKAGLVRSDSKGIWSPA